MSVTVYITTCCGFKFFGLNHSPELLGKCRNCGGIYGHRREKMSKLNVCKHGTPSFLECEQCKPAPSPDMPDPAEAGVRSWQCGCSHGQSLVVERRAYDAVVKDRDKEAATVDYLKNRLDEEYAQRSELARQLAALGGELYQTKISLDQEKFSRANAFEKWQHSERLEKELAEAKGQLSDCSELYQSAKAQHKELITWRAMAEDLAEALSLKDTSYEDEVLSAFEGLKKGKD